MRWLALLVLVGCGSEPEKRHPVVRAGPEPAATAAEPVLRRLTERQYRNSIEVVLDPGLLLPASLEPDIEQDGLLAIGSGQAAISPLGVERYEDAAYGLAEQAMEPGPVRARLVPCAPAGVDDAACARTALEPLARRAWRRGPSAAEIDELVGLATRAGAVLGDFYDGLEYGIAAILQSPHFLYRVELGEGGRFRSDELASRLSFFLWNTPPDDALIAAAAGGVLDTPEGLAAEVDRLLDDPRARDGFRNFVLEQLTLYELDALSKDPNVFPAMRAGIGPAAREETLAAAEALVFDRDDDFRTWLTTRHTFVDPNLAMLYALQAPDPEGHAPVELPEDGPRRGLLGQVSVLAQHAHPVSTSATRRGVFVRETLLCQTIPPPPADLNTAIPEASAAAPTLRERVAVHLENAFCAGCHRITDPIGLGLENFDGLGIHRVSENGAAIDPSGDVDEVPFADALELGVVLSEHPDFTLCMADTVYAYGVGHRPGPGEEALVAWLDRRFVEEGASMKSLLRTVATSEAFGRAGGGVP